MMLEIRDVKKSFGGQTVLDGISLDVEKGDVVAILGPSGSGKTTFLRCLNFLEKADSGSLDMQNLAKALYNRIQSVSAANPGMTCKEAARHKTVLQNVTLGLTSGMGVEKKQAEAKALEMLEKVGMADKIKSYPSQLSGGQQQRVAIARAMATDPEIIYFDEPTSALDPELIGEVLSVMRRLAEDGMTMLVVTHEMDFARNVSNKVMFMEGGKVVETAPSKQFFEQPAEERAREFISKIQNS